MTFINFSSAWCIKFVYLGHVLVPTLSDELDISRQSRSLCARANMLKRNFYACSSDVKILLFQAYCTSLYTSQLWTSYTKTCINKFIVCFNNAFRCVMGYPRSCRPTASGMLGLGLGLTVRMAKNYAPINYLKMHSVLNLILLKSMTLVIEMQ